MITYVIPGRAFDFSDPINSVQAASLTSMSEFILEMVVFETTRVITEFARPLTIGQLFPTQVTLAHFYTDFQIQSAIKLGWM